MSRAPAPSILLLLTDLYDSCAGIQTFNKAMLRALQEIGVEKNWKIASLVLNDKGPDRPDYRAFARNKARFALSALAHARGAETVFFAHANFLPVAAAARLFNFSARFYLIAHGDDVWKTFSFPASLGLRGINRIFSVSDYTRREMIRKNKYVADKIDILPDAMNPDYALSGKFRSRESLGMPAGKMILAVSRLYADAAWKRVDLLVGAMPEILKAHPEAFCVIVGDGNDRLRLQRLAAETGVSGKVVFAGKVPDDLLPSYYEACDLFALPSTEEGFGIVFLEAMSHGKPCVGARAGGVPEVIADGVTGFLAEPGDSRGFSNLVLRLLADDPLSRSMGKAGQVRFMQEFSHDRFREKLRSLLGE